jgi:hypothetical protein
MGIVTHRQRILSLSAACLLLGACAPAKDARAPTTSLRLRGTPPDAVVVVDEQTLGSLEYVQAHGVAMPPGTHRVTVKAASYFPWDQQVEAKPGSPPITLDVALTPIPE